ncbi:MAG: prepilin-type N-terminal cleavage/methylation domain-containing protein [Sulfurimonas sp.]|jgi:prepilin-type N-terminal cleavage/methylation domain-containing protein
MRRGYTLIEIIITIAITGILAVGMFKAFEAITLRSEKAKILSSLSIDSQSALDQLSLLLYARAPMSVKGCDITGTCVSLETATSAKILQWYGTASESYQLKDYSGFVDMTASNNPTHTLYSPDTNLSAMIATEKLKWNDSLFDLSKIVLIFSGSFDNGEDDYNYSIDASSTGTNIKLSNPRTPMRIYEKYNLVDSAYSVTRKADITALGCTNVLASIDDNALLLFYNYRPWKGQNFCTDGNVSILATNVNAFVAHQVNGTIRLGLDMNQTVGKTGSTVRLSKQKIVF